MELTPELQHAFDEELAYLKSFNDTYLQETLDFYLEEPDSPLKSVIQAIAMLAARTQVSSRQQISLLHQRLLGQLVSYLSSPVPAMGLVKIVVENLVEPTLIPAGSELVFNSSNGAEARFQCLYDTPLQPVRLANIGLLKQDRERCQLVVRLEAIHAFPGPVRQLKLCLYGQGNFLTATRLHHLLKTHCQHITASFDDGKALPVDATYDIHHSSPARQSLHPLVRERQYFQLPSQQSFIEVTAGQSPIQWKNCHLSFQLDSAWPENLLINSQLLQLFVVPVENRQAEQTDPIFHRGMQTRYSIRPPINQPDLRLASVRGVYQLRDGEHLPLFSSLVEGERGAYEIVYPQQVSATRFDQAHGLLLNMPEAFDEPAKVVLDGYWHNPGFSTAVNDRIRIYPADVEINGVSWEALNLGGRKFVPFKPPSITLSEQLLELAALKNKPVLSLPELLFLLDALSTVWQGEFRVLKPLIQGLEVKHQSSGKRVDLSRSNDLPTLYYIIHFAEFDPPLQPLVETFLAHVGNILMYWVSRHRIEVIASLPLDSNRDERTRRILDRHSAEYSVVEAEHSHAN